MRRRWLPWLLRVVGLCLLVLVVATQVQWHDEVVRRADDTVVRGRAQAVADGGFEVHTPDGRRIPLRADEVAVRHYGGRDMPSVTYGMRTLAGRLSSSLWSGLGALAILSALVVLTGWRWSLLMRAVDLAMSHRRAVGLTYVGGFFNLAVPGSTGGDVVKAWYAARETGAGTRAVLSVFVDRFVGLFGLVLFAGAVLLLSEGRPGYDVARALVFAVVAGVVVGGVIVLHRGVRRALGLSALVKRLPLQGLLGELRASARLYRGQPGALAIAMGISLFNHATNAVCAWLLAGALGLEHVSLSACLALVPLVNLLSAIPLLPGGWGVGELAFAFFFGQIGVPASEAVGLSVVFRLATLAVNLPGGLLWALRPGHARPADIRAEVEQVTDSLARAGVDELSQGAPAP